LEGGECLCAVEHEPDLGGAGVCDGDRVQGDAGGVGEGPAVDSGGDCGERDGCGAEFVGDAQGVAVAGGQEREAALSVDRAVYSAAAE
jgi:hypothetical protein